jgi:hypothetical protein
MYILQHRDGPSLELLYDRFLLQVGNRQGTLSGYSAPPNAKVIWLQLLVIICTLASPLRVKINNSVF